jgi:hypothetical protein
VRAKIERSAVEVDAGLIASTVPGILRISLEESGHDGNLSIRCKPVFTGLQGFKRPLCPTRTGTLIKAFGLSYV